MKRLVFLFLLALFHQSSFGAIYKCEKNGKVEYQATQCAKGTDISNKIKQPPQAASPISEATPSGTKKCQGKEMSLNFPDITIFTTLHVIADFSGNKLVADPFVGGSGAFYYQCTPWDDILKDIAGKYNLNVKVENGTIFARNR
ncbi:MAG TPA: hypothetical protein VK946_07185 [Methylotenera sp.]|nr:hypothetical protein [Methylotenera sp.]